MNKEFVPYQQSLELKELGYNENYIACYSNDSKLHQDEMWKYRDSVKAPLYQQAFRWFREKHGLYYTINPEFYTNGINFNYQILWYLPENEWTEYVISSGTYWYGDNGEYQTQEEAELACLIKLIEIVKNK